jgi:murein DD-endopeptidase MepM/ murein hydrolase activator NlpD
LNARTLTASALLLLSAAAPAALPSAKSAATRPAKADPTLEEGRKLTALLLRGEAAEILKRFSPGLRERAMTGGQVVSLIDSWLKQYGKEVKVLSERTDALAGTRRYLRTSRFEKESEPVEVAWAFNVKDEVTAVSMRRQQVAAKTDKLDYRTKTPLRLPFDGTWTVWWGGPTLWQNIHATLPEQRFALDFFVMKDGRTYSGDGARNEDYLAWGRPVLAPAAGTVVAVQDGRPDGRPGYVDAAAPPPGNYVVIDHGDGEFSFLLHLQNGSVAVEPGAKVRAGDPLAKAGSSGRTPEPVLHYHLQDTSDPAKGAGLPATFHRYVADGKPVASGQPVRGQEVAPAKPR